MNDHLISLCLILGLGLIVLFQHIRVSMLERRLRQHHVAFIAVSNGLEAHQRLIELIRADIQFRRGSPVEHRDYEPRPVHFDGAIHD